MTTDRISQVRMGSLVRWVLAPVLGVAVFGVWPTWLAYGPEGARAQAAAVVVVLAVMLGSGFLTVLAARRGAGLVSTAFLGASFLRLLLCPALTALVWWITRWPLGPMSVWLVITYLACLALEVVWIVRALRAGGAESHTDASSE